MVDNDDRGKSGGKTQVSERDRLRGPRNAMAFIAAITAVLMNLHLDNFTRPQPEGLTATEKKQWSLDGEPNKHTGAVVI